ncbi:MAG TPA: M61 family peptidase [Rhodanobacteraceae bacterium]
MKLHLSPGVLALAVTAALAASACAQAAPTTPIAPKDEPYVGLLTVDVDLSRAPERIFSVHESIPVSSGPFTMYYPKWIPGEHMPSGPISNVAGLVVMANGKKIAWRRDPLDMYTFHMDIPEGVTQINVAFQFLSPDAGGEFGAGVSATRNLVDMEFNQVAFYPAGYYSRDVTIQPTVELPAGWKFASALQVQSRDGDTIHFAPVAFNDFVDSPLVAGRYFDRVDLAPGAKVPVHFNVVGDAAKDIVVSKDELAGLRNLVTQANRLFGAHHYKSYNFLLTVSDATDDFGLEHHQSSDDRMPADFLRDADSYKRGATLLPHEYVHSWNGKFRRPAKLWTPNFNVPMQDQMLWVYEGLTDYWAGVLATRSGMWTDADYRKSIMRIHNAMAHRTGRSWRSLQDTATAAPLTYQYGGGWTNYRRSTDFYPEGQLLWLDVDTKIRQLSHNQRSLDNFAKLFYGMENGSYLTSTYTFNDVVDALNQVQPFDWATFLKARLDYTGPKLPEQGLARSGWQVVYNHTPDKNGKDRALLTDSIGFSASSSGKVYGVQWNGPAFKAGIVPGMTIVAVGDGQAYTGDVIKAAIKQAATDKSPIKLLVKDGDSYRHVNVDYHGGLKYPHIVRIKGGTDYLKDILAPVK